MKTLQRSILRWRMQLKTQVQDIILITEEEEGQARTVDLEVTPVEVVGSLITSLVLTTLKLNGQLVRYVEELGTQRSNATIGSITIINLLLRSALFVLQTIESGILTRGQRLTSPRLQPIFKVLIPVKALMRLW